MASYIYEKLDMSCLSPFTEKAKTTNSANFIERYFSPNLSIQIIYFWIDLKGVCEFVNYVGVICQVFPAENKVVIVTDLAKSQQNGLRSSLKKKKMKLVGFIGFYLAEPQCKLKSFEREQCGELKSPLITPDKCIKAGCCYDDMFMDEPALQWHNQNASIWCFKMKNILSKRK